LKLKSIIFMAVLMFPVFLLTEDNYAAAVFGEIFDLRQPDGSMIKVRIWGDEFYQVIESLDGHTLVRDPMSREICYAELSIDGDELVSTGISASRLLPYNIQIEPHIRINKTAAQARIKAARGRFADIQGNILSILKASGPQQACNGNVKGICLIVDFPDTPHNISSSDVYDFCNEMGYKGYGNNGSVRDYFYEVSDYNLVYTNYVPSAYYTAPNDMSYYDNCEEDFGPKAEELVLGALNWLDNRGFDFADYDSNSDGRIDAINCFYAGKTSCGWSKGLWPHAGYIDFSADGVESYRYQVSYIGDELSLRTFCHENGHMLCFWPDLYDYDYDSHGIGRYCLMGEHDENDRTNPCAPCAYLKYLAGWATVTTFKTPQSGLQLTAGINQFFKFPHPKLSNEFFMIANRQKTGRDINLPDSGLAIWHIDEEGSNDNQQMTPESHYKVTLVQADGRWDLENNRDNGDRNDLFDAGSVDSCTPFTDPSTNWWAGNASAMSITNISTSNATMWFDFDIDPSPPIAVDEAVVATAGEPMTIALVALDDYLPDAPGKLTYIITSLPSHGTLEDPTAGLITAVNTELVDFGNLVIYKHRQGYLGMDSLSFRANDGGFLPSGGYSSEATISIKVSRPFYVDDDAENDPGPGDPAVSDRSENGSAEHPFDSIQEAIDHAHSTEAIIILPGTYTGNSNRNIDLKGKPVTVRSENGPESCIIDCQDSGRGFYFHSGEVADSVLEGLTITNGHADLGGGIYCEKTSSPALTNCIFTANSAEFGGGMFNRNSSPIMTNCDFVENRADQTGGGIYNDNCNSVMTNCMFNENLARFGGGMFNSNSSYAILANCNFISNEGSLSGGGIYNYKNSRSELVNCIVWDNNGRQIRNSDGGDAIVTYSDIQDGWSGEENINRNPRFVNAANRDYRLRWDSPCIDTGNNDAVPISVETDLEGEPRLVDGDGDGIAIVDMGAYEFR